MVSQSVAAAWSQREWPNAGGFVHCADKILSAQHCSRGAVATSRLTFKLGFRVTCSKRGQCAEMSSLPPHRVASLFLAGVSAVAPDPSSQPKNEAPCNHNGCAICVSSSEACHLQFSEKWTHAVASATAMTATCAEVATHAGFTKFCLSNHHVRPLRGWLLPRCPALCVSAGHSPPGP